MQLWQRDPDLLWLSLEHNAAPPSLCSALCLTWAKLCPRLSLGTAGSHGELLRSLQFNSFSLQWDGNCSLNCSRNSYKKNPLGLVQTQAGFQIRSKSPTGCPRVLMPSIVPCHCDSAVQVLGGPRAGQESPDVDNQSKIPSCSSTFPPAPGR